MDFAHTLRLLRKRAGFDKARGFHSDLGQHGVEINYAYYMKMESGQVLPSHKVVEQISKSLPDEDGAALVLAYCRSQFPSARHLFPAPENAPSLKMSRPEAPSPMISPGMGRELSRRQVHVLARSKIHYHLFLTATRARGVLPVEDLERVFDWKNLRPAIQELEAAKILRVTSEGLKALSNEHQFPSARDFPELKPLYLQFDAWDESFAEDFQFESRLDKMLIQRISPRYLSVIEKALDTLVNLVRAADELDRKHSEDLIQIRLSLKSGRLPG